MRRLRGEGLRLHLGPAVICVRTPLLSVADGIARLYARHEAPGPERFADFHVSVERPRGLRRWWRPQVLFLVDGSSPFAPLPGDQGFPMLEWGMNWCLYGHLHRYLIVHAAVVERHGRALVLPAPPGSGKSTLCAGLIWRGWRLLSDELTLIDLETLTITPAPRPVSLKNASIDVIKAFAPEARFGSEVRETSKGRVAHFRPPDDALRRRDEPALPAWLVLPRYQAGAPTTLTALSRGQALMSLIDNAFNFPVHGPRGFERLADLAEQVQSYRLHYSRLDEATALFTQMADALGSAQRRSAA